MNLLLNASRNLSHLSIAGSMKPRIIYSTRDQMLGLSVRAKWQGWKGRQMEGSNEIIEGLVIYMFTSRLICYTVNSYADN